MREDLLQRLQDEADQCRNDGANDIAQLLDEASKTLGRWKHARERMVWVDCGGGTIKWVLFLQMPAPDVGAAGLTEGSVKGELDAGVDAAIARAAAGPEKQR